MQTIRLNDKVQFSVKLLGEKSGVVVGVTKDFLHVKINDCIYNVKKENAKKVEEKKDQLNIVLQACKEVSEDGRGVFIDQAESLIIKQGYSKHQFAGALSALQKQGLYSPSCDSEYKGKFGYLSNK